MVARYKPWAPLIVPLSVKLHGLVFHIIVFKKMKYMPCPYKYIHFKVLWNVFHMLHWISNSCGIQIPTLIFSRRHCPPCMQKQSRREGGVLDIREGRMDRTRLRVGGGGTSMIT